MSTQPPPDFVVLHPDGQITYGHHTSGTGLLDAIGRHIPDLGTQGMGHGSGLRMWFTDLFTPDMPPNPLADDVVDQLGYHHPTGWFGIVAISAEEPEWEGPVPPLPDRVREVVAHWSAQ